MYRVYTCYGADRSTLVLLYRSLIRSKLDYVCFVYDGASDSSKGTLNTIHHTSLRVVTGAFRTSPAPSLLAEAHEPPLASRRQMLGMRYAPKIRQFPRHYPAASLLVRSDWQSSWNALSRNKLRELNPTLEPWQSSSRRSRREEVILCRLHAGHTYLYGNTATCFEGRRGRCARAVTNLLQSARYCWQPALRQKAQSPSRTHSPFGHT